MASKNGDESINSLSVKIVPKDSPEIPQELKDSDCFLVKLGTTVDKLMIDSAPNLKYIGMFGTGFGHIDTEYTRQKGITVCNIAGYSREGVAELVIGMILEHLRELERAKSQARTGDYSEATFTGTEIKGKNFGVIGLGRNGSRVAELAQCFGASVSYWSKNRKSGFKHQDIDSLLKNSDFISVNLAYVPETEKFFDTKKMGLLKPGCVLVSTVQNEVFDFNALFNRLAKNDITFIMDHSDKLSPEQAKELSKYHNCIIYPPIGYITKEATAAKLGMFVDNLENFLQGKPTNKVN